MSYKAHIVVVLALLLATASPFYIYLGKTAPQCFFSSIYKDERLLVEVQTPIISLAHKIVITVRTGTKIVLQKDVVNQIKLTVPRQSHQINDQPDSTEMEYETCLTLVSDDTVDQNQAVDKKGYILSVKLFSNFDHKLENVVELQKSGVDYRELQVLAKKLGYINSEQINLHQVNQVKEKLSQHFLETLKGKTVLFSMLEILMVSMFTFLQIRMLRGYLNGLSIV